ncbi:hypothetical protein RF11_12751 [Thelohanellus kitauei]|uniref:SAM domain-containing protein n=1 Tax=Thelohanellus kitauei TaxID=669202 RepID=A0A0C2IWU8_THEKT|nr:hypothetical protein RF11_12751 [Thelohanellus kitauei]
MSNQESSDDLEGQPPCYQQVIPEISSLNPQPHGEVLPKIVDRENHSRAYTAVDTAVEKGVPSSSHDPKNLELYEQLTELPNLEFSSCPQDGSIISPINGYPPQNIRFEHLQNLSGYSNREGFSDWKNEKMNNRIQEYLSQNIPVLVLIIGLIGRAPFMMDCLNRMPYPSCDQNLPVMFDGPNPYSRFCNNQRQNRYDPPPPMMPRMYDTPYPLYPHTHQNMFYPENISDNCPPPPLCTIPMQNPKNTPDSEQSFFNTEILNERNFQGESKLSKQKECCSTRNYVRQLNKFELNDFLIENNFDESAVVYHKLNGAELLNLSWNDLNEALLKREAKDLWDLLHGHEPLSKTISLILRDADGTPMKQYEKQITLFEKTAPELIHKISRFLCIPYENIICFLSNKDSSSGELLGAPELLSDEIVRKLPNKSRLKLKFSRGKVVDKNKDDYSVKYNVILSKL